MGRFSPTVAPVANNTFGASLNQSLMPAMEFGSQVMNQRRQDKLAQAQIAMENQRTQILKAQSGIQPAGLYDSGGTQVSPDAQGLGSAATSMGGVQNVPTYQPESFDFTKTMAGALLGMRGDQRIQQIDEQGRQTMNRVNAQSEGRMAGYRLMNGAPAFDPQSGLQTGGLKASGTLVTQAAPMAAKAATLQEQKRNHDLQHGDRRFTQDQLNLRELQRVTGSAKGTPGQVDGVDLSSPEQKMIVNHMNKHGFTDGLDENGYPAKIPVDPATMAEQAKDLVRNFRGTNPPLASPKQPGSLPFFLQGGHQTPAPGAPGGATPAAPQPGPTGSHALPSHTKQPVVPAAPGSASVRADQSVHPVANALPSDITQSSGAQPDGTMTPALAASTRKALGRADLTPKQKARATSDPGFADFLTKKGYIPEDWK